MDNTPKIKIIDPNHVIDCACVIHGSVYDWSYVDKLYSMLSRHLTPKIRLHVYTEPDRVIPDHMIKHELDNWKLHGPKKAWWYKMQLFNPEHHAGPLLYFDLDTVIVKNIDWLWQLDQNYFWGIRDFKYLQKPTFYGINSSVMWWDTTKFDFVWGNFSKHKVKNITREFHGDQDYISCQIVEPQRRYFDPNRIQSWRWQARDGGYDFKTRKYNTPGTGTKIADSTSVLIFHGSPKPNEISDSVILEHWRQ